MDNIPYVNEIFLWASGKRNCWCLQGNDLNCQSMTASVWDSLLRQCSPSVFPFDYSFCHACTHIHMDRNICKIFKKTV